MKVVPGLTPVPYVDETGANATATEYTQIEPTAANWTGGLYVVKGNVTTPGNVTVSGAMPGIILCGGASLTAQGGITLPDGSPVSLTIYGQTGGTGTMTVTNQSGAAAMTDETYGTAPGTPSLAGRTGDSSAPVTWYYSAGDRPAAEWKNIGPDTLDAGTYSLYAVIGETENYSAFTTPAITFRVNKALPAYTAPAGLTAQYDQTLAEIALPGGWSWMEGSTPVGDPAAAAKTFLARFTPITSSGRTLKEAGLTQKDSTLFPADGTLEWVDDGGVPLPETTVEEANRTYRWRFTPADDNYTPLTGEIERYHWTAPDVGITPPVYPVNTPEQGENGSISSD